MTDQPSIDGRRPPALDLGYARLDLDRASRTGDPEVVYGEGKPADVVVEILTQLHAAHPDRAVLATRLNAETRALVQAEIPAALVDDVAQACTVGPLPKPRGSVAVVSAGTSDAK